MKTTVRNMAYIVPVIVFCLFVAIPAFGQGGGKAEPERIEFDKGTSSKRLTGSLSNGQEMEYVFAASAGQTVAIRNLRPSLFDVRIFDPETEFDTEFDSSPNFSLELPATGDYLLYVRKKIAGPRRASFSVIISIK